jgi:hypothetical protein
MSTPTPKFKIPKKKGGDKTANLSRLLGDSVVSPSAALKTVPPSGSRSKRDDDLSKKVGGIRDGDDSLSSDDPGDSDELTPDHPLYGSIRHKDMDTIVVDGNPDVSSKLLPASARDLRSKGIVPLVRVTLSDFWRLTCLRSCELVQIIRTGSSLFQRIGYQVSALVGHQNPP